jgi:membrane-associated protein
MMHAMSLLHTLLHLDQTLGSVIAQYGMLAYALLFVIVFCEMGLIPLFFLPGDPLLFIGGALSATGALSLWLLMAILFAAAVSGSTLNYGIGHALGQKVFTQELKWLNRDALDKTRAFYEKHGGITFILSPYIGVVRTFAPFVAGVSAMTFSKFQLFNIAGAALWVISLVLGGYFFGNIPPIRDHLNGIVLLGIGLGVGALVVGGCWNFFRRHASEK